jgi:predicted RNA-binding Zn-ribbon protein involved in translation (DUF1610 family)
MPLRQILDNTPMLVCPSCGDTMNHLRTIPSLGVRQEQLVFVCPSCKELDTKVRRLPIPRQQGRR